MEVASQSDLPEAVERLSKIPFDLLINNAGVYDGDASFPYSLVSRRKWIEMFETNTLAPYLITASLLENLI
ncbi:MAG: SDR family NAD(P)-dependent oxidoreductase [Bdellovibrionales bacterium]|nr:SDR family NAD(P)-dependent oxidoreductase [Bdellovibrionales bacterium]